MSQIGNPRSFRRAAVKWMAAATATACIVLAVVSYSRFFVWEHALSATSWYQVVVRDANVGLVRVAASFPDERPDGFSLDQHVLGWQRMPVAGTWSWFNREVAPTDAVRIRESKVNCSLYMIAALTLFAGLVWPILWRNRWRAPLLVREIFRPSDLAIERRPLRRKLKRFVAGAVLLLFVGSVALSATDVVEQWVWPMEQRSITLRMSQRAPVKTTFYASTPWSIELSDGAQVDIYVLKRSLRMMLLEPSDGTTIVPGRRWMVERFGVRLMFRGSAAPMTSLRLDPKPGAWYVETSATIPMWMLAALSALMLSVLFLRGPWRRHQRVLRNHCQCCGYCLTGLISPRCPECGTAMIATETGWRPRKPGEFVDVLDDVVEV